MADSKDKPRKKVELGSVRVNPSDAPLVHKARRKVSGWLLKGGNEAQNYLPVRLGGALTTGQFIDWAVTYANVRAGQEHGGWPLRLRKPEHRSAILADRSEMLGDCRVSKGDADAFRLACLSFMQIYYLDGEDLTLGRFLTLAVVGFAECIQTTSVLHNLPAPPWPVRGR